jgi:phosphoserine phosphatase RsbU/P
VADVLDAVSQSAAGSPRDESGRLAAVHRFGVLDTPADGTFDRLTALAARTFGVPIAIVSIVDESRIWFKSRHGLDTEEVDRSPGLCASAILQYEPYVLPDAARDPVALTNPLVAGEFGLRFYAAAPLTTSSGHNLGTFCIIDREPRELAEDEVAMLQDLASVVVSQLELQLEARTNVLDAIAMSDRARADQVRSAELVTALQSTLLPARLPNVSGLELAATFRPADHAEVGGDFYDLFPLPRRAWGIAVGDVCGKGARAAAVSGAARYAVRAAGIEHDSPARVLQVLNETLMLDAGGTDARFCTILFGRLRPHGASAFHVTVASGGHPLPLVLRRNGVVETLGSYGTVVGLVSDVSFSDRSTRLRPGDAVVFFTDGVTEARTGDVLLGSEGVAATIAGCAGSSARDIAQAIEAVAAPPDRVQRDDIAIVVVKVADPPPPGALTSSG